MEVYVVSFTEYVGPNNEKFVDVFGVYSSIGEALKRINNWNTIYNRKLRYTENNNCLQGNYKIYTSAGVWEIERMKIDS